MRIEFQLLTVAIGGAVGAVFRYGISEVSKKLVGASLPLGTLIVNLAGCFLMGVVIGSGRSDKSELLRLGLGVGFLGSLTTFSTFSAETFKSFDDGHWPVAMANVFANVLLGLACVFAGILTGKKLVH